MSGRLQLLSDFEGEDSSEAETAHGVGSVRLRRKNLVHMARGNAFEGRSFTQRGKVLRHKSHSEKWLITFHHLGQADAQIMYPVDPVSRTFWLKGEYPGRLHGGASHGPLVSSDCWRSVAFSIN